MTPSEELLRLLYAPHTLTSGYEARTLALAAHFRPLPLSLLVALAHSTDTTTLVIESILRALPLDTASGLLALEELRPDQHSDEYQFNPNRPLDVSTYLDASFENPTLTTDAWVFLMRHALEEISEFNSQTPSPELRRWSSHPKANWPALVTQYADATTYYHESLFFKCYDLLSDIPEFIENPVVQSFLVEKIYPKRLFNEKFIEALSKNPNHLNAILCAKADAQTLTLPFLEKLSDPRLATLLTKSTLAHLASAAPSLAERTVIFQLLAQHPPIEPKRQAIQ